MPELVLYGKQRDNRIVMKTLIGHPRSNYAFTLFVIYLRYLIGGAFVYAGFGKAMGDRFMPQGSLQIPAEGMSIDVFFEVLYRTGIWWQFLGWGQVVAGLLVVTQRWSTLGAVLFLPVSLNIFMITISMDFHGTPVLTGLILLANLGLLIWDYERLRLLLIPDGEATVSIQLTSDQLGYPQYWAGLGLLIFLTSISFGNRENVPLWFVLCVAEGMLGLLGYGFYRRYAGKKPLG